NQIVPEPRKPGPPEHHSLRFLRIARECGAEISDVQSPLRPGECPGPNQTSNIERQISKIGICPGAEYGPAKRWLPERFAEVAAAVAAKLQVQWILLGIAQDAPIGEQISRALGDHCINRIGQTTLEQLIEALRECCLLLTYDTD